MEKWYLTGLITPGHVFESRFRNHTENQLVITLANWFYFKIKI